MRSMLAIVLAAVLGVACVCESWCFCTGDWCGQPAVKTARCPACAVNLAVKSDKTPAPIRSGWCPRLDPAPAVRPAAQLRSGFDFISLVGRAENVPFDWIARASHTVRTPLPHSANSLLDLHCSLVT
jgi:hypothetical protein